MRHYKTEKIGSLLQKKRYELDVLKLVKQYKELSTAWANIPDPTLQKIKVNHQITQDNTLQIVCPSSVALTYVRQRRDIIESSLRGFMSAHLIKSLEIIIK
ncbi:DciA family protein [Porphyromonas levii]|nr:DciA family protein [Porphyromonas levii]MBR8703944.1 hypothetical protein [Porphyromonas levii]MBR8713288.1 hypothetical protein [Porphyromonas levii]MBR8715302.1 hypothetical protein [Porphyromonas levii]MBR8727828.1 hypothetical protein [Porphyromonas levii]MBR8731078.1 hypothetical protein [Porphyromonas levii]